MAVADETKLHKKTKVVEKYVDSSETDEDESIESGDDMESGDEMESENESLIEGQKENDKSEDDINDDEESGDGPKSDDGSINSDDVDSSDSDSDISDIPDTFDSGGEGDAESDDEDNESSGTGLGAVMSSILKTQKKSGLILSKAKKDYEIRQTEKESDDEFEVLEEGGNVITVKKDIKKKETIITRVETEKEIMLRRKEWENMNRVWPDVQADREKERKLRILATQGVVQLLGAIDKHAKSVDKKLSEARGELQKDKVLETTGKEAFMAVLKQEGEKVKKSNTQTTEVKTEVKEEPDERISLPSAKRPRWGVLADNFYNEPTLDGWDKESDEE